ncbi:hypothetical protein V6N12_056781 [Hibiscus sabdariffa]|uniref:Uncharacterized protein n=1 Tax=Hibiscus sabdariffa TaxID=183260 RepID=A0ABR2DC51_9ROSI
MATSPSQQVDAQSLPPRAPNEAESVISSLVYGVLEEIKKCKDSALERQKCLEDEKEQFQKAAYTVLEMLNSRE